MSLFPGLKLASRWQRLAGAIIDFVVAMVIGAPLLIFGGIYAGCFDGKFRLLDSLVLTLLGGVVFLVLNGILLWARGQTIGKLVVGTKIVNQMGDVPDFSRLIVRRYLAPWVAAQIPILGWLFGIFNMLFIFFPGIRCIHDHIADTWVIET